MKENRFLFFINCLLLILSLFLFSSPFTKQVKAETKTLKIGLITSMTGPMAPAFRPMFDAVKPTEDLMNKMGGITINDQKYNIKIMFVIF